MLVGTPQIVATHPVPEEAIHVVGPVRGNRHWHFLCPVCDNDRVTGIADSEVVCTTEWLEGRQATAGW